MIAWIAFYVALTAAFWAALYPMLRTPRLKLGRVPVVYADVPDVTYDSRGLY